jgi:hypothetical protein
VTTCAAILLGSTERDEHVRAQPGGMAVDLPLEADREAEPGRDQQSHGQVDLQSDVDHAPSVPASVAHDAARRPGLAPKRRQR